MLKEPSNPLNKNRYHITFIDAIGAVYDWNALFDGFPGSVPTNVYRGIWLTAAVVLWVVAEKKEKQTTL